jgi:hypothetical protein
MEALALVGTAVGVLEGVHPPATGGGGGGEPAAALAWSATPSPASGAGSGALPPVTSPTPVVDVGAASQETEEEERVRVVDSKGGRRESRTAGLRRFDFCDPIGRNSWTQRHALGAGAVAHLGPLAVGFGSFEEW